jgi:cyclopropane fatty-acyl-phospholipid synthase-like methyltransferase
MNSSVITWICLGSFVFVFAWLILARIIRQRYPFPIPHFMIHLIDNPFRRMAQPLHKKPERLGIKIGMTVLEIGPGSGTYTLAAAETVGPDGKIVAVDIEDRVVQHVQRRIEKTGVTNIEVYQGDAQSLDFPTASFDAIYAITVFGEIPDRGKALTEFQRVLVPGGTLALSEFLLDPDSQPSKRVRAECEAAGFRFREESGNLLHYTMMFDIPGE